MKYEIDNKIVNIPDKEITELMSSLDLTKDQAIELWLDDNGITTCDVVEELTKKAKENKADKVVGSGKQRKPRAKVDKSDPDKEYLISLIADIIKDNVQDVAITNKTKIIEFNYNDNHYKLDLVRQRKPKN